MPNAFVPGVRRALRNRPFRILLGSYAVGSVTAAMPGTLLPFYIAYVIRPERVVLWTTLGVVAYFLAALATIVIWVRVSGRLGKKPVWLASIALQITALGPAFFLAEGDVLIGVALFALAGVGFGGQIVLTPSIQADVIDYDELHTGRRREAQYGALWALLPKLLAIPGAAIPLSIFGALGYRPNVAQSPDVVLAIRCFFAAVPVVFASLSLLIAMRFPIDEKAHREIRRGIARHARGESAEDPLTGTVLPPVGEREVEEETSWLLDHHSPGELRRALRDGSASLLRDALLAGAGSLVLAAGSVALALSRIGTLSDEPGPVPVIAIVVAGISLSTTVFHALRIRPALALRRRPAKPDVLQAHLEAIARERGEPLRCVA
jgi:GPH family glycoside/pentoside/hexuronide:cation symporter